MQTPEAHIVYGLAWISFAGGHSALAALGVKDRLGPLFGPYYRLSYNLFAAMHILLVLSVGWRVLGDGVLARPEWLATTLTIAYAAGWVALLVALAGYDLGRLAGLKQIRYHLRGEFMREDEPLRTDGLHRYVRHPLYAGAVLVLLGRIDSQLDAATAFWGCLYLLVGTVMEERKLLKIYGRDYARYRRQVPAVIPWKGRAL